MNTDLISRADAEALFRNTRSKLNPSDYKTADEFNTRDLMLLNAEQMIHLLPSVTPKQRMGHWIEDDMTYCGVELTNYKCDKCGEIGGSWRKGLKPNQLPKYCQWCGAKMGEMKE